MTERVIVYPTEGISDTDMLRAQKAMMVSDGWIIQAFLGNGYFADGLACTPGTGMNVSVAAGAVYTLDQTDATGYGSLGTDTHNVMKQGLSLDPAELAVAAPGTAGQSINYLIQAAYQDTDTGSTLLPYLDPANPIIPYSGPANDGIPQNTIRRGACVLSAKAGAAAATGSQTTPSPDSDWIGLYVVTVANGATSIVTGNIAQIASAPFITPKLPTVASIIQSGIYNFATDTGSVNALSAALTPVPAALTPGLVIRTVVAVTNTGASTINVNGLGAKTIIRPTGLAVQAGDLRAGGIVELTYDGISAFTLSFPSLNTGDGILPYAIDTGSANAYAIAPSPGLAAYAEGASYRIKFSSANTGASTLNVSGLGAKNLTRVGGGSLLPGMVTAGGEGIVTYDGTEFQLLTAKPPFSAEFISAPQTLSSGGVGPIAHGLGVMPKIVEVRMLCISSDQGCTPGQEFVFPATTGDGEGGGTPVGAGIIVDATNIQIKYTGTRVAGPAGAGAFINLSSWEAIFRAWA